jgi:hypothetical protein
MIYLHKTILRLPNYEIISATAIYPSLQIRNLLKLVSKKPKLCPQLEEMKSFALCSYAICQSFLFGKLELTKNTPARIHQILTVVINQNSIHENEITKPERRKRRKIVTSTPLEYHFQKERLEKKQKKISKKGSDNKANTLLVCWTYKIEEWVSRNERGALLPDLDPQTTTNVVGERLT